MRDQIIRALSSMVGATFLMSSAAAAATCVGACGTLGATGVVTTSPQGGTYDYVTTDEGDFGVGQIDGVGGTNGSSYTSTAFEAATGDLLEFYFNYVTSDGAGYSDYGWAELVDSASAHVAWLFTGRTQPTGDTSPGFGLPTNDSTLIPSSSEIVAGAPIWSPLGSDSDRCYADGCGYTGWIKSEYTIAAAGTYSLVFGVTNFADTDYASGLAFDGASVGGVIIDPDGPSPVPLPASALMLGAGLMGLGALRRRRGAR